VRHTWVVTTHRTALPCRTKSYKKTPSIIRVLLQAACNAILPIFWSLPSSVPRYAERERRIYKSLLVSLGYSIINRGIAYLYDKCNTLAQNDHLHVFKQRSLPCKAQIKIIGHVVRAIVSA